MLWAEHVARNTARERDDVFGEVRRQFDEAELVELTGVCGLFAQSNRFQDSLRMPIEEPGEVSKIGHSIRVDTERLRTYIERIIATWPADFPAPEAASAPGNPRDVLLDTLPEYGPCRAALPDPETAHADTGWFLRAAGRLLGGVPNAVRLWANVPHLGKLILPFHVAFFYEGVGSGLPSALKGLVLVRISHVNEARYSLAHRTAMAQAAGVAPEALALVASDECTDAPRFSPRERAALAWAGEVARNTAKKRNDVFQEVRKNFSDAGIVELTGLCAISTKMDRVENALRAPLEDEAAIGALYPSPRLDPARLKDYLAEIVASWPREFPVPR